MAEIDRATLMADALRQTTSIAEALALVDRVLAVAGVAAAPVTRAVPPLAPTPTQPLLLTAELAPPARKLRVQSGASNARKKWLPLEIARAEALLDGGLHPAEVGPKLGRTAEAITQAINRGVLHPKVYQGAPSRVAAGIKGAITKGQKLSDYGRAQAILDQADGLNGEVRL